MQRPANAGISPDPGVFRFVVPAVFQLEVNRAGAAGIDPTAVQAWFLMVFFDAYEWVEMPNVVGMALFADGGFPASKPHAASGACINRMSDCCASCRYDVKLKEGEKSCRFNYLYWNFLIQNQAVLKQNHRIGLIMGSSDKMSNERRTQMARESQRFLEISEMAGQSWDCCGPSHL